MGTAIDKMLLEMVVENKEAIKKLNQFQDKSDKMQRKSDGLYKRMRKGWLGITAALAGVTLGIGKLVGIASRAQETISKFNTVFKNVQKEADSVSKNLSRNFGLSSVAAKRLLSDTGDLLTGFGFTGKAALDLSKEVNELAVDLASFTNFSGGAEGASQALTKALLGERESIKSLGISIMEADVQARVLANTKKGLTFATERQAKAYATLQLAQEQSKNAQGDFARTSEGFANQMRILKGNLEDFAVSVGKGLMKVFKPFVSILNSIFGPSKDLEDVTLDLIKAQEDYSVTVNKLTKAYKGNNTALILNLEKTKQLQEQNIAELVKEVDDAYKNQIKTITNLNSKNEKNRKLIEDLFQKTKGLDDEIVQLTMDEDLLLNSLESGSGIRSQFSKMELAAFEIKRRLQNINIAVEKSEGKLLDVRAKNANMIDAIARHLHEKNKTADDTLIRNEQLKKDIDEQIEKIPQLLAEEKRLADEKAKQEEKDRKDRELKRQKDADEREEKRMAEAERKRQLKERRDLIDEVTKFEMDSEKALTKLTNKQLKERLKNYQAAEKAKKEVSKLFVDTVLTGMEDMKSSSKEVLADMVRGFASMVAARLAIAAAENIASIVGIPIGIAQLAAAGAVKIMGNEAANTIMAAEQGMDSAPGGPVLVGEAGPEVVYLPKGAQVVPNHKINMARFGTIPAFQHGGVVGGETVNNNRSITIENITMAPETPADFVDQLMAFTENVNVDILNP